MTDALQAPANLLTEYVIDEIQIGEFSFRSDELRSVELPVKGFPAWRVTYDQGVGPKVLVAANVPVCFTGTKIIPPPQEEAEEEPSAEE